MRFAVLTSTPLSATAGSGTFVALDGLVRGLRGRGHQVTIRGLRRQTGFHTLDRWLFNLHAAVVPPLAEVVVGIDLDGFLWARRKGARAFVVALKGIIADELRNERGWVRRLLSLQARWERTNCARADRVIVPSRYSASIAGELYGVEAARLAVVPEPIDLAEWRRLFGQAQRGPAARPTILCVARMYPRKRVEDLLEAASTLRRRIPTVQIRIVGHGPEWARLQSRHARLDLGDTVVFLGEVPRSTLAVEYMGAHCFCLPSVQEGFGLAFVEAMAAGLPVVACRAGAIPEVVLDRRTGLLVAPRRPAELAQALETVLGDEGLRKTLGEEGRRRVDDFDLDRVAGRFLESLP
ncbi:MAG TPA: glycosyltransferase family 4 protein [Methylomirabilota bacterium]|nr:glycosyltransferase family 4 protein [Methylomirabilota bacterium]